MIDGNEDLATGGGEEEQDRTVVLSVFGASGRTGKHVVECALSKGWSVKALVRNPSSMGSFGDNEHLTVIQGDLRNAAVIQQTVRDATYVISCAGGPHSSRRYERGFMTRFISEELWPAVKESKPKALLFQAGALSKLSKFPTFGQLVVAPMLGLRPMALDNDSVMRFIDKNPVPETRVIVTRPGSLVNSKGGSELTTSRSPAMVPIAFADLGKFNVKLVADESFNTKYPYIARKHW